MRLVLNDKEKINQQALDDDPDLKGTFEAGGMFQIIVGPGDVDIVYDEFTKITGDRQRGRHEKALQRKQLSLQASASLPCGCGAE